MLVQKQVPRRNVRPRLELQNEYTCAANRTVKRARAGIVAAPVSGGVCAARNLTSNGLKKSEKISARQDLTLITSSPSSIYRASVGRGPSCAGVHLREKFRSDLVEEARLFEIDRVPGSRKDGQCRGRAHALDEDTGLEAIVVFVAADHVQGHLELAAFICG